MNRKILISCIIMALLNGCGIRNKFTFFPDKETVIPTQDIPPCASEIRIQTSDGEKIQAFLFKQNEDRSKQLIIYFHGNGGNIYHRFKDSEKLSKMNHDVLLVSYRGYAKSTGKSTEKGIYIDGESAVNYAIDSLGYEEKDISIFGRSLGTTVAIKVAQNRNFRNVILITPLSSGKEMAIAMGLGLLKFIAGNSFNSFEKINNLKSPVLIIHGTMDRTIPYYQGKMLFDKYTGIKKMITIKGGGHNDLQDLDPRSYWGEIKKTLNK